MPPIVLDRDGEVSIAYRVGRGLPVTMLIDPQGVIERIFIGQLTDDHFAEIDGAVGE